MKRFAYIFAAGLLVSACSDVEKSEIGASTTTSNVKTTEPSPGVITGEFKKDATGTQRLVGSATGAASETYIEMPAGALSVDTAITMQEGSDLGAVLPAALGLGEVAILGGSHATMIGSNPAVGDTTSPFTLSIPLPLDQATGQGLHLTAGEGKLGILYLVKASAGNKIGLFILGKDDLLGTIVKYKGARLGWFRIVLLSSAVATVEKDTTDEPTPKS